MKLNPECIRDILIEIEATPATNLGGHLMNQPLKVAF